MLKGKVAINAEEVVDVQVNRARCPGQLSGSAIHIKRDAAAGARRHFHRHRTMINNKVCASIRASNASVDFNDEIRRACRKALKPHKFDSTRFGFHRRKLPLSNTLLTRQHKTEGNAAQIETQRFIRSTVEASKRINARAAYRQQINGDLTCGCRLCTIRKQKGVCPFFNRKAASNLEKPENIQR